MALEINKVMERDLDKFLAERTVTDIDRTKFIPFSLRDNTNKLTTCLVFNCNCHSYEDPTIIPCEYTGVVIHLPAFWIEVPKELAYTYLIDQINQVYNEIYKQWAIDGKIGNIGSTTPTSPTNPGCPCNPNNGWVPVN